MCWYWSLINCNPKSNGAWWNLITLLGYPPTQQFWDKSQSVVATFCQNPCNCSQFNWVKQVKNTASVQWGKTSYFGSKHMNVTSKLWKTTLSYCLSAYVLKCKDFRNESRNRQWNHKVNVSRCSTLWCCMILHIVESIPRRIQVSCQKEW